MNHYINTPIENETIEKLNIGDSVFISGTIYVARDAAHKRIQEMLDKKIELPFELKNNIIYYMGPSPAREGRPIGSAGPTTSGRMDKYAPTLLDLGLKGMIGKGKRNQEVKDAVIKCKMAGIKPIMITGDHKNTAVYFAAVGGAGALLSKAIQKSEIIAFEDLGAEAILKLEVKDFPVIVVMDYKGNDLYEKCMD